MTLNIECDRVREADVVGKVLKKEEADKEDPIQTKHIIEFESTYIYLYSMNLCSHGSYFIFSILYCWLSKCTMNFACYVWFNSIFSHKILTYYINNLQCLVPYAINRIWILCWNCMCMCMNTNWVKDRK